MIRATEKPSQIPMQVNPKMISLGRSKAIRWWSEYPTANSEW